MSHLHRQLAAQNAIACDKDAIHACTPVQPNQAPAPKAKAAVTKKAKRRGKA